MQGKGKQEGRRGKMRRHMGHHFPISCSSGVIRREFVIRNISEPLVEERKEGDLFIQFPPISCLLSVKVYLIGNNEAVLPNIWVVLSGPLVTT